MRVALEPAFILHRRPYRETSLIVDALTETYGRVALVAKGARRPKQRHGAALQSLAPVTVSWTGRGDLVTLTDVELVGPVYPLSGQQLLCVLYLNELITRLLIRFDPHPELYHQYGRTLTRLIDQAPAPSLREFEKRLLDAIGYGLQLTHCAVTGEPVAAARRYRYVLDFGPVDMTYAVETAEQSVEVSGATLIALNRGVYDQAPIAAELRRLLQQSLDVHLQGKPLRTRELLRQYWRRGAQRERTGSAAGE